jgi:hypothetical protein
LKSQYRGNKTVAKNPTISIDVDDPRVSWDKIALTKSRIGAEIDIIGLDGKSLISGGLNLTDGDIKPDQNQVVSKPITVPGVPTKGVPPLPVENLVADWGLKDDIVLTFDFDTTNIANAYIDRFIVKVYDSLTEDWHLLRSGFGYEGSTFLNTSSAQQELTLHASDIYSSIDINTIISNITKVAVATADILNIGEYVEADLTEYESPLPQPIFTLLAGVDYYTVTLDPANLIDAISKGFAGVIVEEQVTTELIKENVSLTTGWSQAAPLTSNSTIVVYAPDAEHRWVRIKYVNALGNASVYSDIADITPDAFMPPNTDPPDQFTAASIVWVGDDIKVNFTLPEENIPARIWVRLRPYINNVESPPTIYSDHYHEVDDPTDFFIRSTDLKLAYGTYYSKFKGYIKSVSSQGVPSTSEIISGPITRSGLLTDIYPTLGIPNSGAPQGIFRVTPSISSYVVDFDLPAGASRLEVYESPIPWTAIPTNDDLVVYSGLSPAIVGTPIDDFEKRYVIVRYYDLYGGYSHYSMEKLGQESGVEVTPIDIGLQSLITYPIKISTNGSIFSGIGDKDDNPRVFFNPGGLYAYDALGAPTTQLINNAAGNTPTFITRNAKIAEWSIAEKSITTGPYQGEYNYIQNNIYVGTNQKKYTGMSSNGPYSFWAGASADLNLDDQAEFSVKPNGEVVANKITINGDGTEGILIDTANFTVSRNGTVEAVNVNVSGELNVTLQSYFDSNVNIRHGYLITGEGGFGEGPNVQIGSMGLQALDSSDNPTTKIYSDPKTVTVTNALTGISSPVSGITLWTKKALFKSQEPGEEGSGGFVISDGVIQSNQILIDSVNEQFVIRSTTANSTNGIILQASSDSDYSIAVGNLNYFVDPDEYPALPIFSVSTTGLMTANNAVVKGIIKATEGFFGTENGTRWIIGTTGITASGVAKIDLSSGGVIKVGSYEIKAVTAVGGDEFSIIDTRNNQAILVTDKRSGTDRIFLGQNGRQVEVKKPAQISGAGTTLADPGDSSLASQAYRSGGLRNMFTVAKGNYDENPAQFPSAENGDVLLVYTP